MDDFERLCHDDYQTVRRFLLRLCGNEPLADELTQETFEQAYKGWKHFRGQCAPSTWLCGIAKRLYFQYCRKPPPTPLEAPKEEPQGAAVEDALLDRERRMLAYRLLHRLPEPYREVMMLRTFGELTHAEIGALFDKGESWARLAYFRARQKLNEMMEENEHDDTV